MTDLDKSTSQLDPINPITGDELVAVTQAGQSRKALLSQIVAYLMSGNARASWGNIIGTLADQADLQAVLAGKANTSHTHAIAQITNLQAELNNRAVLGHTHTQESIIGLINRLAGIDQAVLEEVASRIRFENRRDNPHQVTAAQVGLGVAENTADLDKPVSLATQAAIEDLDEQLTAGIINVGNDSIGRDNALDAQIGIERIQREAQDTILSNQIGALANGATRAFLTYADLDAAKATLPPNSFARVTNDPTPANNWLWQWNGTVLTKSARDDLAQAIAYVDANPLFKPINLTTAVNLNTITTPYLATVTNPANITLALNFPVAAAIGTLEVLRVEPSATVFQKYTLVDSSVYVRAFTSGNWSAWTSQSVVNRATGEVNRNKIFSLEDFDVKGFVQSTNLFDGAELNTSVDLSGNIITEAGRWLSGFYPIKTGEVFKIPSSSYRVVYYDENKNFLLRSGTADTVNPSVGVARGYFRLSGTNNLATMQLNKGTTLLPYEPHYIDLKNPQAKPPIEPSDTVFFDLSKNLFDKSEVLLGKSVDLSGNIVDDIRWLGDFIPCVGSQVFSMPNDSFRIAYYDASKTFLLRSGAGGGGVTSFTTPNSAAIAYMRFSGIYNLDLMQVNQGATLLPYQVFGEEKLKTSYLPADLGIDVDALREDILSEISVSQYEPSTPTLTLTKVEETWRQPLWLSADGATMYGALGGQLLQSTDDWVTRVNIGAPLPNTILAVRVAGDGQLLVATVRNEPANTVAKVYKTVGYNRANPSAATFIEVLANLTTQANINNAWGFSVYNNIVTVSDYGLRGAQGAKHVYLSQDNGNTFSLIFNQDTQVIAGRPPLTDSAHMHTAAYDPYYNRIWVIVGDNPNTATYYSDDMGATWTFVIGTAGAGSIQFTGIQALPNCVIFGSDRSPNGIYVYRRNGKDKMPVIKPLLIINDSPELTHVFGLPFKRDWLPATPTYFAADKTDGTMFKPMLTATVDGGKGHILGELSAGESLYGIFGATASGKIIVVSQTATSAGVIISTAPAPTWTRV